MDFVNDKRDRLPQHIGDGVVTVVDDRGHPAEHRPRSDGGRVAVFGQQPSNRVDSGDTRSLPLRPDTMNRFQCLLCDRLHRHWTSIFAASGLKERVRVRAICLVSPDVGSHVLHWKKPHTRTTCLHLASPIMRGAARFHDHTGALNERSNPSLEVAARQALTIEDVTGTIGDGDLEHVFGQVDSDGRDTSPPAYPATAVSVPVR